MQGAFDQAQHVLRRKEHRTQRHHACTLAVCRRQVLHKQFEAQARQDGGTRGRGPARSGSSEAKRPTLGLRAL
jgi:hypothetical protein